MPCTQTPFPASASQMLHRADNLIRGLEAQCAIGCKGLISKGKYESTDENRCKWHYFGDCQTWDIVIGARCNAATIVGVIRLSKYLRSRRLCMSHLEACQDGASQVTTCNLCRTCIKDSRDLQPAASLHVLSLHSLWNPAGRLPDRQCSLQPPASRYLIPLGQTCLPIFELSIVCACCSSLMCSAA